MDTKAWYASKTIWGAAVMGIATLLQQLGVGTLSGDEQGRIIDACLYLAQFAGFIVTLVGRFTAKKNLAVKSPGSLTLLAATVCIMGLSLVIALNASAATVNFAWDQISVSDLAGYRLYQSTASGQYTYGATKAVKDIPAPGTSASITVPDGTYYWVATSYDKSGNESGPSNEVTLTIDTTAPPKPANLKGSITVTVTVTGGP